MFPQKKQNLNFLLRFGKGKRDQQMFLKYIFCIRLVVPRQPRLERNKYFPHFSKNVFLKWKDNKRDP